MADAVRSRTVAASPAEVWAVLSDFAGISSWAPNVDHSCLLSDQLAGVGAVRRIQTGRVTVVERVVDWAEVDRLAYRIEGLPPAIKSVINAWELEPDGDGCRVTLTTSVDVGPRPPQQLVARGIGRRLAGVSDQMLDGLAAVLTERSAA